MKARRFAGLVLAAAVLAAAAGAADPPVKIKVIVPDGVEVEVVRVPVTPPDPPPPGPVVPAPPYYFQIVRPDGPASPAFTAVMRDPAWGVLRAAGHSVRDYTLTEFARAGYTLPGGTLLPTVVTLKVAPDRKSSTIVVPARPLPAAADILKLPPSPAAAPKSR